MPCTYLLQLRVTLPFSHRRYTARVAATRKVHGCKLIRTVLPSVCISLIPYHLANYSHLSSSRFRHRLRLLGLLDIRRESALHCSSNQDLTRFSPSLIFHPKLGPVTRKQYGELKAIKQEQSTRLKETTQACPIIFLSERRRFRVRP